MANGGWSERRGLRGQRVGILELDGHDGALARDGGVLENRHDLALDKPGADGNFLLITVAVSGIQLVAKKRPLGAVHIRIWCTLVLTLYLLRKKPSQNVPPLFNLNQKSVVVACSAIHCSTGALGSSLSW